MFKHSFCLLCSHFIYLPISILEGDGVEAAFPATSPAELYCISSHILNFDGHWHCKVKSFIQLRTVQFTSAILHISYWSKIQIKLIPFFVSFWRACFSLSPDSPTKSEINCLLYRCTLFDGSKHKLRIFGGSLRFPILKLYPEIEINKNWVSTSLVS